MARLSRIIRELNSSELKFTIEDKLYNFDGRAPLQFYFPYPDYEKLYRFYGQKPRDFREKIANLVNPECLEGNDDLNLRINWITSPDVIVAGAGYFGKKPFFQLSAIGVLQTRDNQILVGVKGGDITPERVIQFGSGLYGVPPGGSVQFRLHYNKDPIIDTIIEEFYEEIGEFKIISNELIGIFEANHPGPEGIKFVSKLKTDATLHQIQKKNIRANELYYKLLSKGASERDAKEELKQNKLPPDAWEHSVLIGIPNDSHTIKRFTEYQPQSFSGIGEGTLFLYAQHLENIKS